MTQCPYQKNYTSRISGKTEVNELYQAWHDGYEAHKLDLMNQFDYIKASTHEFLDEARKISELKRELKK